LSKKYVGKIKNSIELWSFKKKPGICQDHLLLHKKIKGKIIVPLDEESINIPSIAGLCEGDVTYARLCLQSDEFVHE
jgi:hypothetical protein